MNTTSPKKRSSSGQFALAEIRFPPQHRQVVSNQTLTPPFPTPHHSLKGPNYALIHAKTSIQDSHTSAEKKSLKSGEILVTLSYTVHTQNDKHYDIIGVDDSFLDSIPSLYIRIFSHGLHSFNSVIWIRSCT